ncbi:hypothetical protein ACMDCR_03025 [Labrys okinawensis]|uniref:hypothetical protein n=1 Tax=Labrys okinawensis TaxID=346911 RepID=UPI0039BD105E
MIASQAAQAASWDRFDGAWAVEGENCSNVFTTRGGKTVFSKHQGSDLPGFIVQGGKVSGLTSQCSITSRKDAGDTMNLLLHCRSQIIFGDISVTIKIKDDNTIVRMDPAFPDVQTTYNRCK